MLDLDSVCVDDAEDKVSLDVHVAPELEAEDLLFYAE